VWTITICILRMYYQVLHNTCYLIVLMMLFSLSLFSRRIVWSLKVCMLPIGNDNALFCVIYWLTDFVESSCCTICNFVSSVLSIIICLFSLFCWSLYYLSSPVVSNLNILRQTSFHFKTCLPFKSFLRLCVSYLLQWPVQYCLFLN
jgi:hypothetical protein